MAKAGLGGHRLELQGRHRALDERDAEGLGGARQGEVAAAREEPVGAGRSDGKRQRQALAEHLDGRVAARYVDERPRHEGQTLEHLAVAPQRHLVLGAALEIFEDEGREPPAGEPAQLLDAQASAQVAARVETALHIDLAGLSVGLIIVEARLESKFGLGAAPM